MARKRVPRPYAGGTMTKSAFFEMIRNALRRVKWKPRFVVLDEARRKLEPKRGNQKYEYQCSDCKCWFKGSEVEVDHIIPCGSLKCWEDVVGYAQRLYCEAELLRVLCRPCHLVRTNKERKNKKK